MNKHKLGDNVWFFEKETGHFYGSGIINTVTLTNEGGSK